MPSCPENRLPLNDLGDFSRPTGLRSEQAYRAGGLAQPDRGVQRHAVEEVGIPLSGEPAENVVLERPERPPRSASLERHVPATHLLRSIDRFARSVGRSKPLGAILQFDRPAFD
jgi:hypothetical protein